MTNPPPINRRTVSVTEVFSRDEIHMLTARSDVRGAWAVAFVWLSIGALFGVLAMFPNPLIFVVVTFLLGGRHLALAILMHEAAHRSLFKSAWCNDVLADWLCARPAWNKVALYRKHHLQHHAVTNTEGDPDWSLSQPYPMPWKKLRTRLIRDITGQTGLRRIAGLILMDMGLMEYTVAADFKRIPKGERTGVQLAWTALRNMQGMLLVNGALFAALYASGHGWMFWAWVLAYLGPFSLFVRVRAIAEHAGTEVSHDPFRNTRTTHANWLARATVAPYRVNYHLEHHFMAAVPYYRLPTMHRMLKERRVLVESPNYLEVLRRVSTAP